MPGRSKVATHPIGGGSRSAAAHIYVKVEEGCVLICFTSFYYFLLQLYYYLLLVNASCSCFTFDIAFLRVLLRFHMV